MDATNQDCFFHKVVPGCKSRKKKDLKPIGEAKIDSIKNASLTREDDFLVDIQLHPETSVCHKDCFKTYTSKGHLQRIVEKRKANTNSSQSSTITSKRTRTACPAFNSKLQCIFCGNEAPSSEVAQKCKLSKRERVNICRGDSNTSFKDDIIQACSIRGDSQADEVLIRVSGVGSDLTACDVRYHRTCRIKFMGPKELEKFMKKADLAHDKYLSDVFSEMTQNIESSWTIGELCTMYESFSHKAITKYKLLKEINNEFGKNIIILSAQGMSTLIMFRQKAGQIIKLVEDDSDTDTLSLIKPLAKQIRQECIEAKPNNQKLNTRLDRNSILSQCSETFNELLNEITSEFVDSPESLLLGSALASRVNKRPTDLQIALGVMVDNKRLVQDLQKFGVTCSYEETKVFKRSSAIAALKHLEDRKTFDPSHGMIQVAEDNFDRNIATANCLSSTHALATIYIQSPSQNSPSTYEEIPEIPRITTRGPINYTQDENKKVYCGTKQPNMPAQFVKDLNPSNKVKKLQNISWKRAEELDLEFFKSITTETNSCPEYGGYLVRHCRD